MYILNSFTAPGGGLVACMPPRELKWEEVGSPSQRNDTVDSTRAGELQVACKALSVGPRRRRALYKCIALTLLLTVHE